MIAPVGFTRSYEQEAKKKQRNWSLLTKRNDSLFSASSQRRRPVDSMVEKTVATKLKRRWSEYLNDGKTHIYYVKVKTAATDWNFVVNVRDLFDEAQQENFEDFMTILLFQSAINTAILSS